MYLFSSKLSPRFSNELTKIGQFQNSRVNYRGQISTWCYWISFSPKNSKLEEHLSLRSFSILVVFDKLYLVNSCSILVSSFENLSDSWKKTEYIGLISDQNWPFCWMGNLMIRCYVDSTTYTGSYIIDEQWVQLHPLIFEKNSFCTYVTFHRGLRQF